MLPMKWSAWSGLKQMVQYGTHPGKSIVVFMSIIDMDATVATYHAFSQL